MKPFLFLGQLLVFFIVSGALATADEVIRIMAANLTSGNGQDYDPGEGNRIMQGLAPDVVLIQEMNYKNNTTADLRGWIDATFGTGFSFFRQSGSGIQIPNGIVSRYPILASGIWDDTTMVNRDYSWARIDIPGDKDLWAVSVHLSSGGGPSQRNTEAAELKNYIFANIPAGDYLVLGGDLNTTSRTENCVKTLATTLVTTAPFPVDQANNGNTNSGRNNPYDWVLPDSDLNALKTPLVIGSATFPDGLVFDSRRFTPLSAVAPVLLGDSGASGMQHMAVMRAFSIPTNAPPLIANAADSSSTETVTDPDASVYEIVRASSVGLSVTATDDEGEAALTYTWSLVNGPGSPVVFLTNGTNTAKNTTAAFQAIGDYTFTVTVQDALGLSVASSVKVRVTQKASSLTLNPSESSLSVNATQAFSASLLDQFSQPMTSQPSSFIWSASGGGTLSSSGLFTATTAGGPYVVTASSGGFSQSSNVTVARAAATIRLANLSQTYDGSGKSVTATTSPAGHAVSILYNGNATPPTDAGSYAVTASITDPNYQGSSAATLVLQKASASIQLAGLTSTYDGRPKPVSSSTVPAGRAVSILYDGSITPPTNAGSYAVTASITDANYQGTLTGTLVVQKAAVTIDLVGLTTIYDGSQKLVTATTTPAGLAVSILYNGNATPPTNAGNYAITASVTAANYQGASSGTMAIQKGVASIGLSGLTQTYDGSIKEVTASTSPAGRAVSILYNGSPTPPTASGSYAITASVMDANYQGSAFGTLVIAKATVTIHLSGLTNIYDGTPKLATASTMPVSHVVTILYDGIPTPPIYAGNYSVTASVSDVNYEGNATGTLVIQKADAVIEWSNLTATYDGNPKTVSAVTNPSGLPVAILYDNSPTPPTHPGSYIVTGAITDKNYQGGSTATLVIAPDVWRSWKDRYFSAQEQDAGIASDVADPDSDGLANLAEYALGTNPREFTPPLPGLLDAEGFSIIFTRPANLPGIQYSAEVSDDLQNWSPALVEWLSSGAVETLRARDPLEPNHSSTHRALRLRFERE